MDNFFDLDALGTLFTTWVPKLAGALITLIIGLIVIGWITNLVRRAMEKRDVDPSVSSFLASLTNIGLKILLLLSVVGMFGVDTTSFIAIFSAMAFAVGLALQGNLGHFASGVLILVFKPYRVGDVISSQGYTGVVREIQIFNTILTTLDNRVIILPNGSVLGGPIENFSTKPERQLDLTFGIGYTDDIDQARTVLAEVISGCPGYLEEKGHNIFVKELADSSVNFAVRFWTANGDYWPAFFHMHEQVKKAFDANGVSIPFPQMDVHVDQPGS